MGRGKLTRKEQKMLKENPFVIKIKDNKQICYSEEFKRRFIKEDMSGKKISHIFRDAGFDTDILGSKRIERSAARWREAYEAGRITLD